MDKYEYKVKTEQMLEDVNQGQYKDAMAIADTIDWRRVKNSSMLSRVSEIYEHEGEYQKSRDVLLLAYDRAPESREIVYNLGQLALKLNDLDDASDCYDEFVSLAPQDPNQYLLKYQILKAQNGAIEDQIAALEDYKKEEYTEEWGYELAKLYDEAGETEKCLDECDDLVLWFSEGEYVYKAMELKMKYKPLTPLQQDIYDRRFETMAAEKAEEEAEAAAEESDEEVEEAGEEAEEAEEAAEETEEVVEETDEAAEEAEEEPETEVEEVSVEEEIPVGEVTAAAAEEIPQEEAVEEETVTEEYVEEEAPAEEVEVVDEADNVDVTVDEFPEEGEAAETVETDEPDEEDGFKHSSITTVVTGATLEEALANGMAVANGVQPAQQADTEKDEEMRVSGQMKIDEILQEWEAKQEVNAEAIEKQKAEDEAKISEEREAAEKKKEEGKQEVEKKAAEADAARKQEREEKLKKAAKTAAAGAAGVAGAAVAAEAVAKAADEDTEEAGAATQKLPDDIQELVAQLESRVNGQGTEEIEEDEEIEDFDTDEELELEQVEKLDMPSEDDYEELASVIGEYEDEDEDEEEDIEEDFVEETDGQVSFRLDEEEPEEAEEEAEAGEEETEAGEEAEAEEITEDVVTAEIADEAVEEAVEEVEEEDFEEAEEDLEEEDFEETEEDLEEEDFEEAEEDLEEEDFEEAEEDLEEEDFEEAEEDFAEEDFEENEEEDFEETGEDLEEAEEDLEEGDFEETEEDFEEAEEDLEEAEEDLEEEDFEEAEEDFEEEDFEEAGEDLEEAEEDLEEEDFEEAEEDFEEAEEDVEEAEEDFEEEEPEEVEEEDFEEEEFDEDEDLEEGFEEDEEFEEEEEEGSDDLGEDLSDEFADFDDEEFYDEDEFPEDVEEEEEQLEIEEPSEEEIEERINKTKGSVPFDTGFVVTGRYDLSATSEIGLKAGLTEDQKKLFSYFVPVRGMSEQLVEVLDNDRRVQREGTSKTGNLLIIGRPGSGKTVLAVDVVKAIQKQRNLRQGKVAIVTGESLNKKELTNIIQKLKGGAIIVEKAGKLNTRTIKELNMLMEKQTGEMLFVLEDQRKPLERILTANPEFKKKFTSKLELPIFINDELVTFGQTYAKENGYKLDEMGILALYSRIDVMQREDHAVSVAEVKEIMDEAIDHSQKANVKHLARRVFGKSTDDSERIILKEEDFKV